MFYLKFLSMKIGVRSKGLKFKIVGLQIRANKEISLKMISQKLGTKRGQEDNKRDKKRKKKKRMRKIIEL